MEPTTIAIDLAERVFQIHYFEPETGAIHSKVLKRGCAKRRPEVVRKGPSNASYRSGRSSRAGQPSLRDFTLKGSVARITGRTPTANVMHFE